MTLFEDRKELLIKRVNDAVTLGNKIYTLALPVPKISFDLKGRCAGMAIHRFGKFSIQFNADMIMREAFDHLLNDTAPHEVAHSFCQFNPQLGSNHDYGWANVCRALGGSGKQYHSEDVVYGKGATYEYISCAGVPVRLSQTKHNRIQQGQSYSSRTCGKIDRTCQYSIVGAAGRTFATPTAPRVAVPVQRPTMPAYVPKPVVVITPQIAVPMSDAGKAAVVERLVRTAFSRNIAHSEIVGFIQEALKIDIITARDMFKVIAKKQGILVF
jgi:SprT protein